MKFRVLSDSSCDITKEQEERYHIASFHIMFPWMACIIKKTV